MVVKSKQSILWRLLGGALVALLVIFVLLVANATALQKSDIEFYDANNILFYDGEACASSELGQSGGEISGGGAIASGSSAIVKIWQGLKSVGLTDAAAAAVIGNMDCETGGPLCYPPSGTYDVSAIGNGNGFNPVKLQGGYGSGDNTYLLSQSTERDHGLGLVQWDSERRPQMYNYVVNHDSTLAQYFSGEYGSLSGDDFIARVGNDIANRLYALEIDYIMWEATESPYASRYGKFLSKTTPEDAAMSFDDDYEISWTSKYGSNHGQQYLRTRSARGYYDYFTSALGMAALSDSGDLDTSRNGAQVENEGENVTIIGDSITLGALNYGSFEAVGLGNADVKADNSKSLDAGGSGGTGEAKPGKQIISEMASSGELRYVVVVALGTNGAGTMTASRIQSDIIDPINASGEHLIVLVTNFVASGRTDLDFTSNNNGMREAKNKNNNVVIADWAAVASDDIISDDGLYVHPTPDGSKLFAQTIYKAITNGSVEAAVKTYNSKCKVSKSSATRSGVTYATYNGTEIAFPIAGATRSTISGGRGSSGVFLSNIPCNHSIGCHYGAGKPAGTAAAAFDVCLNNSTESAQCVGSTVVSITSGTITRTIATTRNGAACNHVRILSDYNNKTIAYMHLEGDSALSDSLPAGTHVDAGTVIGHVSGNSPCHDNSTPHVHIDMNPEVGASGGANIDNRDPEIVKLMNTAYGNLPEDEEELAERERNVALLDGEGLTLEQAEAFIARYKSSKDDGKWVIPAGTKWNCFSVSSYFIQLYTTYSAPSGEGGRDLVYGMARDQGASTGSEPRPFAVFSVTSGSLLDTSGIPYGHTGLVIAVDGDTVTTIEAYYGDYGKTEINTHPRSYFQNTKYGNEYAFVYLESAVDMNKLLNAIEE